MVLITNQAIAAGTATVFPLKLALANVCGVRIFIDLFF